MTIAAEATEANGILLVAECRRCLQLGVDMKAPYVKMALALAESCTTNSLTARVDIVPDNPVDGRNTAEVLVIT